MADEGSKSHRTFVIGDIHGCLNTFQLLLEKIDLQNQDHLILLGDYISKGPDPLGVIHLIQEISLLYKSTLLLGNHDEKLLRYLHSPSSELKEELSGLNNSIFLNQNPSDRKHMIQFLESLKLFHESPDFIFVHAGLDFSEKEPFSQKEKILNIRGFEYNQSAASGKTIIHGHVPTDWNSIQKKVWEKAKILPLDNGCVYKNREAEGMAGLVALELGEMRLFRQANAEQQISS